MHEHRSTERCFIARVGRRRAFKSARQKHLNLSSGKAQPAGDGHLNRTHHNSGRQPCRRPPGNHAAPAALLASLAIMRVGATMLVVWYLATDRIKQSTSMQTVLSNQPTYHILGTSQR